MSFSYDTKSECARLPVHSKIEALLELSAMARLNAAMVINRDGHHLRFFSEHPEVISCVANLSRFLLQTEGEIRSQQDERLQKKPVYYMDLPEKKTETLLEQSGVDLFGHATQSREAIFGRLRVEANACAYLRGAFLAAGSVVDPEKSYHLEVVTKNAWDGEILEHVFRTLSLPAKQTKRGAFTVYYFKDSEAISDMMIAMGASASMLALENVKIKKELKNEINRKSNAETANLDKQYQAALEQIRAIHCIDEKRGLESLSESLRAVAQARLEHPMANLRQLGEQLNPPLSKSGVMHRMRRLLEEASMLEEK
ncbi:DNA-binding protein WhiA [Murdochiella vaginalis]|uniref:DNA-binding protein WhiA n=1 Tax=Murdochiella vaginalis TaxID=1852373 RepID=UPI0008FDB5B0|nr:DNA-binding protein WhiA [Murdochiella vaginalis]